MKRNDLPSYGLDADLAKKVFSFFFFFFFFFPGNLIEIVSRNLIGI